MAQRQDQIKDGVSDGQKPELNRLDVLRGLRASTLEGSFATVHIALTTGNFIIGYAMWLGADDFVLGLLAAIPTLAGLIQIISSYLSESLRERKLYVAITSCLSRTIWLAVLFLPRILGIHRALGPFLVIYAISFILAMAPIPAWTSWMSDLVPADHRGRYFGRRNMICGLVGMLVALPAAWILDYTTKRHHWEITGFGILFGVAVAAGIISFLALMQQPEPPRKQSTEHKERKGLHSLAVYYKAPFSDINFRRMIIFNAVFIVGQTLAGPFFTKYALTYLKLDYTWLQIFGTMTGITALLSMPVWGYLADKFGNKPIIGMCVVGVSLLPPVWVICSPHRPGFTLIVLTIMNFFAGPVWAGVGMGQFNLLMKLAPREKTPVYVAMMTTVTGLAGGLAPLLGGKMMMWIGAWGGHVHGLAQPNYDIIFLLSSAIRLLSLLWLRPIKDSDASTARDVLSQIGAAPPAAWLHIRDLQRPIDDTMRLKATGALADSKTRLAVGELVTALKDPSPAVRSEAARALGEIADPRAVPDLISAALDSSGGIAEEAARALGRIGAPEAASPLAILAADATAAKSSRIAAAWALGAIGGEAAGDALQQALTQLTAADDELMEAFVRAIGHSGDIRLAPLLLQTLEDATEDKPLRVAAIRSLGELGSTEALPLLRAALQTGDPAVTPTVTDALARLNDKASLPEIYTLLLNHPGDVARKQIASAAGALLDDGKRAYGLLAQEGMARESTMEKLFADLGKRLKAVGTEGRLPALRTAYAGGNYGEGLRIIREIAAMVKDREESAFPLWHDALDRLGANAGQQAPQEAFLLAASVLRCLVEEPPA